MRLNSWLTIWVVLKYLVSAAIAIKTMLFGISCSAFLPVCIQFRVSAFKAFFARAKANSSHCEEYNCLFHSAKVALNKA